MDLDMAARDRIKKTAADNGLEISCVAAYNDLSSPIEEHRENELLMVREQIRLATDLGAPIVRVFAAWSGVTRRDGVITYDLARYNIDHRYPGTTALERWCLVRDTLREACTVAEHEGITLALQNHGPIIMNHEDLMEFVHEIDSPALRVCLDSPLMHCHTEAYYREAVQACEGLMVHTHFGGRFQRLPDGRVVRAKLPGSSYAADDRAFLRIARDLGGFDGHIGYELCSPVTTRHCHEGLGYALLQAELAAKYMRDTIHSL